MRIVGHVTATVTFMLATAFEIAPMVDHTKPLWPCASFQGWKWSEIHRPSKPACSAISAWRTRARGSNSSLERK